MNPMAKLQALKAMLGKKKGAPAAALPPAGMVPPAGGPPEMSAPPATAQQRRMGENANKAALATQNVQVAPNLPPLRK